MSEHITWLLLSTNNPGRGPETYGDAKGIYRWNNRVPNSKQLAVGNRVVIADNRNDKIIALGSIARIDTSEGTAQSIDAQAVTKQVSFDLNVMFHSGIALSAN